MSALEKFYKNLFELSPLPMWVYDVNTLKFLDVNQAAELHYGYSRKEFLSMTIQDIRPEEDFQLLYEAISKIKQYKEGHNSGFFRHKKKNGDVIDVEVKGNIIETENNLAEIIAINDITDKLKNQKEIMAARKRLELSERRFKALIQNGSDLTSIINEQGVYQFVSENALHLVGVKPEVMIGTNVLDFIHPDDRKWVYTEMLKLYDTKRVFVEPFRFLNSKKEWRWLCTTATNMLDDPAVAGIITNSRDVTDTIEQDQMLKEIAWTQSHDVRSHLARIMGLVDLLQMDGLNAEQKEIVSHLSSSTMALDQSIRNIVASTEI